MVFKAKELKRFKKFLDDIFKVYPLYNQQKYFQRLLDLYKTKYKDNKGYKGI